MHRLIEGEIAELQSAAKRTALTTNINNGAIASAIAGIEPALATLNTRILTVLQNRRAELIVAQSALDAATPKPKPQNRLQNWLGLIGVARNMWWLIGAIIGIGLWVWKGFPVPF